MTLNDIYWAFYNSVKDFSKTVSKDKDQLLDNEPSIINNVPTYYIACGS